MTRFQWHEKKQKGVGLHGRGRQAWGVPTPARGGGGVGCMRNANGHLVVPEIAAKTAARHSLPELSLSRPLTTVILV